MAPGGYRPIRLLSHTPFGRVLVADDAGGRRVVLKELSFHLAPDAKVIDDFERETALLASLEDPRIPAVLDAFSEGKGAQLRLYQVQSLIEGRSLLERLAEGPLPSERVREIAAQLLSILERLHSHVPPIVHRDLKPANVIERPDGSIALVDFGAARELARGQTHGATLVGTVGYMPPEQLGGTVTVASDLYALGATLVHLLSGASPAELITDGLELRWRERVSRDWRPFLDKLMARSPKDRFASASVALAALRSGVRARKLGPSSLLWAGGGLGLALAAWLGVHHTASSRGLAPVRVPAAIPVPQRWPASMRSYEVPTAEADRAPMASALEAIDAAKVESAKVSAMYQLLYATWSSPTFPTGIAKHLVPFLSDSSVAVRQTAARVLGMDKWLPGQALVLLLEAADHEQDATVRRAEVRAAVGQLERAPQDSQTSLWADRMVTRWLSDPDREASALAGIELPRVHPLSPAAIARVREALGDSRPPVRNVAMATLYSHAAELHIGEPEALQLMQDRDPLHRQLGILALTTLAPTPKAIRALTQAAHDPEPSVRDDATRALAVARQGTVTGIQRAGQVRPTSLSTAPPGEGDGTRK